MHALWFLGTYLPPNLRGNNVASQMSVCHSTGVTECKRNFTEQPISLPNVAKASDGSLAEPYTACTIVLHRVT